MPFEFIAYLFILSSQILQFFPKNPSKGILNQKIASVRSTVLRKRVERQMIF